MEDARFKKMPENTMLLEALRYPFSSILTVTFAALGLDDGVEFPSIAGRRRFVCTQCGARAVSLMPDWRKLDAPGMGR